MTDEQAIRDVVHRYVDLVATGTAAEIADLYSDGATVEDPVGSGVLSTHEQLLTFYANLEPLDQATELRWCRVVGHEALFEFAIATTAGEKTYRLAPVDHMVFDDAGRITSMRAFWGPADMSSD